MSLTQFNTPEHALDWLLSQGLAASVDPMARSIRMNSTLRAGREWDIDQGALRVVKNAGWMVQYPRVARGGNLRFVNIGQAPEPAAYQWGNAAPAPEPIQWVPPPVEAVRGFAAHEIRIDMQSDGLVA